MALTPTPNKWTAFLIMVAIASVLALLIGLLYVEGMHSPGSNAVISTSQ
jgi:hypothetical protein